MAAHTVAHRNSGKAGTAYTQDFGEGGPDKQA